MHRKHQQMKTYSSTSEIVKGSVFGHLVVQDVFYKQESSGKRKYARCLCVCGKEWCVRLRNLGRTTSCGCRRNQNISKRKTKHGCSKGPKARDGYTSWLGMKKRCNNPLDPKYPRYGGRGISVCQRWVESFESFISDMGDRPSLHHSIDRIDNDGDYCPENCRWASASEQSRNRANIRAIELDGTALIITEWAARIGINPGTLFSRLRRGWSVNRALREP